MEKRCFKCSTLKPLEDFYAHPAMKDGTLGKCKECTKADRARNYRERIEKYRDYERRRARTKHRRAWVAEQCKKSQQRNPEKWRARSMVNNALLKGKLEKEPCRECGTSERVEAHHADYSKPLDVVWLCFVCHRRLHGQEPCVAVA